MKKYFVHYYLDFGNTYNLYWAETPEQLAIAEEKGYERITRKKAEQLCADENERRRNDGNSAYYATSAIYPIDCNHDLDERYMTKDGYLIYCKRCAKKATRI